MDLKFKAYKSLTRRIQMIIDSENPTFEHIPTLPAMSCLGKLQMNSLNQNILDPDRQFSKFEIDAI